MIPSGGSFCACEVPVHAHDTPYEPTSSQTRCQFMMDQIRVMKTGDVVDIER